MKFSIVYYTPLQAEEKHLQVTNALYTGEVKPKLDNSHNAFLHLGIEQKGSVLAFASLFININYPDYLLIGNYECTDDQEVADFLFAEIDKIAVTHNRRALLGPINGDTWHDYRFSVLNKPRFFMEAIHQSYYVSQWQRANFSTFSTYQTNIDILDNERKLPDYEAFFNQKGITYRHFNKQETASELALLHEFCNVVFQNNLLFSPISCADFTALYKPVLPHLNENLIYYFLEDNKLIGLLFAVENAYNPKQVMVKTIARNTATRYNGLATMTGALFLHDLQKTNYETMLHAYFHLDNKSKRVSEDYGGKMYQQHILLQRQVK